MPKKYDLVLFDMDGTIVNSDDAIAEAFVELYDYFKPVKIRTKAELYYFSGPPIEKTLMNEFPGYDIQVLLDKWHEVALRVYKDKLTTYPDQHEVLKDLITAGYRLGIVTNKISKSSFEACKICKLEGLFETMICRDNVPTPKPSGDGVELAMKNMGFTDKSRVIYVGDNTIDYQTAKNAGVDCILVTWGPRKIGENLPGAIYVSSFKELRDYFIDE